MALRELCTTCETCGRKRPVAGRAGFKLLSIEHSGVSAGKGKGLTLSRVTLGLPASHPLAAVGGLGRSQARRLYEQGQGSASYGGTVGKRSGRARGRETSWPLAPLDNRLQLVLASSAGPVGEDWRDWWDMPSRLFSFHGKEAFMAPGQQPSLPISPPGISGVR
jgi:hypothetical protein